MQVSKRHSERGFSMVELMVAVGVMLVVGGAVFTLVQGSMKISSSTYEMTETQQTLRVAHEFINRDLMNAGDGLKSISNINVPRNFVLNYTTRTPIDDPATPTINKMGLLTTDNNISAGTAVLGSNPTVTVRATPALTDRITMLEIDPTFTPIALAANKINLAGTDVSISTTDVTRFAIGEIYFITSSAGGTLGTITNITGVGTTTPALIFGAGDTYGLNIAGTTGQIGTISGAGTLPTSLLRLKLIHYYVNSNGLLMRRVFGVKNAGFSESAIAEHVISIQFRYFLDLRDSNDRVVQPVTLLSNSTEQLAVRQVEVAITAETPHIIHQGGAQKQLTMTTSTSVRNMQYNLQFRKSLAG